MTGYVVYMVEYLRDGKEESAKCFESLERALRYINHDYFAKDSITFRLFEMGKEILLTSRDIEEPQPAKVKKVFILKQD